jgi:hypothetical protein
MVDPHASKIRRPSSSSIATSAKSKWLVDVRAAVMIASNCKCDRPTVGDSGGMLGPADVLRG